jgi:hypothetical protein
MPPGCAGVSPACAQSCAYQECGRPEPRTRNQEPRTTCILGARASRPHARDPGAMSGARASCPHARNPARTRSAGVPNREPRTKNREPRASWVRGRPARMHAIPARCRVRGRPARMRAILRVPGVRASRTENQEPRTENHVHPGCAGVPPAYAQSCAYQERGRPEPRARNQEPRTTCPLGARASRPHGRDPGACRVRGRPARMRTTPARTGSAGVPPACVQPQRLKFCPFCSIMTVNENQAQAC